ncbi:MAG: hypothetical protein ACLQAT_08770 [Candidatus Binataceae bacterium]
MLWVLSFEAFQNVRFAAVHLENPSLKDGSATMNRDIVSDEIFVNAGVRMGKIASPRVISRGIPSPPEGNVHGLPNVDG